MPDSPTRKVGAPLKLKPDAPSGASPQHATFIKDLTLSKVPAARVEIASDGFDAGALAESLRPHLVVLDLNMPRIDGIEVCRRLRARDSTSAARIVLLSGQLTPASIDAVREAGADAWLEKGVGAAPDYSERRQHSTAARAICA